LRALQLTHNLKRGHKLGLDFTAQQRIPVDIAKERMRPHCGKQMSMKIKAKTVTIKGKATFGDVISRSETALSEAR
jgi:hypothetical protein